MKRKPMLRCLAVMCVLPVFAGARAVNAGAVGAEEKVPAAAGTAVGTTTNTSAGAAAGAELNIEKLELCEDKDAGYSMRVPPGYTRLSQDESREVLKGISQLSGKEVSARALRQPPVYFRGPADPAKPKAKPPSLEVSCTGAPLVVDAAHKDQFMQRLENDYDKNGIRHGDISLEVIQVAGVSAYRAEHDTYSPVDNTRNRAILVFVPGPDRRYDIAFNFSPHQAEGVAQALNIVLKTFKLTERPLLDPETQTAWGRVALWTVGGFLAGIVLSVLLKLFAGKATAKK